MKFLCSLFVGLMILTPVLTSNASPQVEFIVRMDKQDSRFVVELRPDVAAATSESFLNLVRSGFYRGLAFHRAVPGFLVQTGDPLSRRASNRGRYGTGGPGFTLPAEIRLPVERGSLVMSRMDDDVNPARVSNGSQFFVSLSRARSLDGRYTVFGRVVEGMETIDALSQLPTDGNEVPYTRAVIRSARILE